MLALQDYRCVIALAEERHFGRAARRLGVTQPALTARLRRLEGAVRARLFDRSRAGVEPTAAGVAFIEGAQRVLDAAEAAADAARGADQGHGQTLRIGMTQVAAHQVVPRCLARFRQTVPKARIRLVEGTTAALEAKLEHRQLDAAFLHPPLHAPDLSQRVLLRARTGWFDAAPNGSGTPLVRYPRSEAPVVMGMLDRVHDADADGAPPVEANTVLGALVLSLAGYGGFFAPVDYPPIVAAREVRTDAPTESPSLETSLAWRSLDRRDILRSLIAASKSVAGGPATGAA